MNGIIKLSPASCTARNLPNRSTKKVLFCGTNFTDRRRKTTTKTKYNIIIQIFNFQKKDSKKSEKFLTILCHLLRKIDEIKAIILNIIIY